MQVLWIRDGKGGGEEKGMRTRTLVSPAAVARRPLPEGSKWAE